MCKNRNDDRREKVRKRERQGSVGKMWMFINL